jgi:toxin ParE1/3/4
VKSAVFHSEARTELDEAIAYYEQHRVGLGLDLLSEVQRTIARIHQNPQLGAPYKATALRRFHVGRFPYVVFYAELEEFIWVIAVAHGKRRPDYWQRRQFE